MAAIQKTRWMPPSLAAMPIQVTPTHEKDLHLHEIVQAKFFFEGVAGGVDEFVLGLGFSERLAQRELTVVR